MAMNWILLLSGCERIVDSNLICEEFFTNKMRSNYVIISSVDLSNMVQCRLKELYYLH